MWTCFGMRLSSGRCPGSRVDTCRGTLLAAEANAIAVTSGRIRCGALGGCPGRHRCGPHPRGRHWVVLALVVLAVLAGRGTTCVGTPSIPVQVTINTTEAVSAPRTTAVTTTVTTPRIGHGASLA